MLNYLLSPEFQIVNTAGKPCTGYLEVFIHGTRNRYYCSADWDGTLHPFRVPLDSLGSNVVLADESNAYDVYVYNRYGSLLMSRYNVHPSSGGAMGGTITSSDGSIEVTQTENGYDLKVSDDDKASALKAGADTLYMDGYFSFRKKEGVGDSIYMDNNGHIFFEDGWYHFSVTVKLNWAGIVSNETNQIKLYTALTYDIIDFDFSYNHVDTIQLDGDIYIGRNSTQYISYGRNFILGIQGMKGGMSAELVCCDLHSITGHGFGQSEGEKNIHRLLRYYTNAADADAEHPEGDWLHDLDSTDESDPSGHPLVTADQLFSWYEDGQIFDLYEIDRVGGQPKWSAVYRMVTWQDQSDWWSQDAQEPGKAVRIEFFRMGMYSTPYRGGLIAYIRYKNEDYMRLYEVKPGESIWTAEYQSKLTAGSNITIQNDVISATAEPQQQSNWAETDTDSVSYIQNKPDLSVYATDSELSAGLATKQDVISDLSDIRSGAALGETSVQPADLAPYATTSDMNTALAGKQDVISDLADIRSGAALGTTSVQPADLAPYATTSDMNTALATKQDTISDLSAIRSGAQLGATSVQDVTVDGVSVVSGGVAAITTPTFTQQQANWTESDTSSVSYIQNKPSNLVQDANYVHTDNNFTNADATKLSGIEANAEVNVQSDWSEADSSSDAFIKNKPQNLVQDASYVHTDNNFTNADATKLSGIEAGAEVNVQSDWSESDSSSDAYIRNKPDLSIYAQSANLATVATTGDYDDLVNKPAIPAAQINSDWNSNSGVSQILNKPQLATVATTGDYADLVNKPSIPAAQVQSNWSESDSSAVSYIQNKPSNLVQDASYVHTDENFTSAEKTKLAGIAAGAEVNVQSDWTESDSSSDAFIQNKPQNLVQDASYVHTDENFTSAEKTKLAGIEANAEVNVQADWNESDSSSDAYIQNKPDLSVYATQSDLSGKQDTLTAGSNITISNNTISATDTTYTAGTGISISNQNVISNSDPLPAHTSSEEGKVLKVDSNGDLEWGTGGGGSQVQSDWAETDTTDPSYIENKPTPKTLVAGQGIAISESSASLTVTNTVARDAVNLVAGSGVTLTQSGSDLTISSAGTTYTAGEGIDITNDEISLEAPVDLVGGPGITVDNPDGNTVRVSLASTPYNETVLWEADLSVTVQDRSAGTTFALSETPANFEILKVYCAKKWPVTANNDCGAFCTEVSTAMLSKQNGGVMMLQGFMAAENTIYHLFTRLTGCLTTNITEAAGLQTTTGQGSLGSTVYLHPYRIVGINRISGGN